MATDSASLPIESPDSTAIGYYVLLIFGVWTCATAIIFIKLSSFHPVFIVSLRLLMGATILFPLYLRDVRRSNRRFSFKNMKVCILPAIFLALHFVSWVIGARLTLTAQASLIVNLVPLVMPFFLYFVTHEKLNRPELIATPVAVVGLGILAMNDFHISAEYLLGDAVCFGSMLFFSYYLILSRKHRDACSIFEYVVPLYAMAGLLCLAVCLVLVPFSGYLQEQPDILPQLPGFFRQAPFEHIGSLKEWGYALGLALLPTVTGHTILNLSMKKLRGQTVTIFNGTQFIFAGIMAYFILKESPSIPFYPAAALIITSAVIAIRAKR